MDATDLPSLNHLRSAIASEGEAPFHVGIVIGPGFNPMDMVGVQSALGIAPCAQIHLLWKTHDSVEGFPSWWTRPNTTFDECPEKLDVISVPMLMPEVQNDPEVVAFVAEKAKTASYIVGFCNGVLVLGAAGLLKGRRVTASHNALPILHQLGVAEVVPAGQGAVVDGNLYTAGPGVGSFEVALRVAEAAFGRKAAEAIEVSLEYDPHLVYGMGVPANADPELVAQFEKVMEPLVAEYRRGSVEAFKAINA